MKIHPIGWLLALLLCLAPAVALAQTTVGLTATPIQQFEVSGIPCLGCKVFVYAAGTTTKITTYTDSTGATPQVNPIITNSRGEPQNTLGSSVGIWVSPTQSYKLVFALPTDTDPPTSPIWTLDNIPPNGGIGGVTALANNNTALSALPHTIAAAVTRLGFAAAGDGPALVYLPSASPCSLNSGAGDGGSQVPTSDGGCWLANFVGPPDARTWGATYPFTLHVNSTVIGNTDTNNWCFNASTPCATLQHATNQALRLDFQNQSNTVSLEGGASYAGTIVSGAPVRNGAGGISGQYLVITGGGSATVTAVPGQVFNIEASSGAQVLIENLTCSVSSGHTCTFDQNSGTVMEVNGGLICQMASGSAGCLYAEGNALLELSTAQTLTIQGTTSCAIEAASGAVVEQDPGTGTTSTGTGLTITSGGGFLCPQGGFVEWGWATVAGSGATGDLVKAILGGRLAYFNSPPDPPGNGFVRMNAGTVIETGAGGAVYPPTVGSCSSNCSLQAGATNYDMNIMFTGSAANATVTFGKPSGASGYFSATPACTATLAGAAAPVVFTGLTNTGFQIGSTGNFLNNQIVSVHCAPPNGG